MTGVVYDDLDDYGRCFVEAKLPKPILRPLPCNLILRFSRHGMRYAPEKFQESALRVQNHPCFQIFFFA